MCESQRSGGEADYTYKSLRLGTLGYAQSTHNFRPAQQLSSTILDSSDPQQRQVQAFVTRRWANKLTQINKQYVPLFSKTGTRFARPNPVFAGVRIANQFALIE